MESYIWTPKILYNIVSEIERKARYVVVCISAEDVFQRYSLFESSVGFKIRHMLCGGTGSFYNSTSYRNTPMVWSLATYVV